MPQVPITMPQLGESMAEATIVAIKVQPGEKVAADQEIIEVETDKAVMGVSTPCAGEVAKIDAEVQGTYAVGAVLGYIEASEADAARYAVDRHAFVSDPFGERAAADAKNAFQLKCSVLPLTKSQCEPRIVVVGGVDMRNAPLIAVDANPSTNSVQANGSRGDRQAPAQQQAEQRAGGSCPAF